MCSAHLAEAVTLPGAWSRRGCLEQQEPLPGLSGTQTAGHCQSQGVSCVLETPRVQSLDLSPVLGQRGVSSTMRTIVPLSQALAGTWGSLAWLFPGCVAVEAAGLHKQGSGERLLPTPVAKSLGEALGAKAAGLWPP